MMKVCFGLMHSGRMYEIGRTFSVSPRIVGLTDTGGSDEKTSLKALVMASS